MGSMVATFLWFVFRTLERKPFKRTTKELCKKLERIPSGFGFVGLQV